MTGAVLDAGALIGFERNDRRVVAIVRRAVDHGDLLIVPAPVVSQVWRDGRRQVRLVRLLGSASVVVEDLDDHRARAAGQVLGVSGTTDVVDAAVVVAARAHGMGVVTSDPGDLERLDPALSVTPV